ncbi:MAG: hypothetical protein RR061_04830 [Muribaculaceae bacterium]
MKRKFYLAAVVIACSGSLFAQPKSAGAPQLFIKADHALMSPVWSPDGKQLAVTGDNYTGIWVMKSDGSGFTQITADSGVGYKMAWSQDGKAILARANKVVERRKFYEIKSYDVINGREKVLVPSTRSITGTPIWSSFEKVSYADASGVKTVSLKGTTQQVNRTSVYEKMMSDPVNVTSKVSGLSRFAGKMVINAALSADKSRIVFQIPGAGCFVCKADGTGVISLGKGSYPAWLPDNKTIIVSRLKDNGVVFTSSDLYAVDVNNGNSTLLTGDTNLIPVTHAVSPDGKRVAFENSDNGCIYIMNLKY